MTSRGDGHEAVPVLHDAAAALVSCDYRRRREVKTDVGRTYAWGYAQYDRQLTLEEIQRYELAYGGEVEE